MPPYRVCTPAPRSAWRALLAEQGPTPIESTPEWMDCIVATGKHDDASRLYQFDDGTALVLPLATARRAAPIAPVASLPFDWGFGGVVGGARSPQPDHIELVLADVTTLPSVRTRLAFSAPTAPSWVPALPPDFDSSTAAVQVVDLHGGWDAVFGRFKSKRRWAIRRAERLGVQIRVDRTGADLGVYFDLFDRSIERWAAEQHEPLALCRYRNYRANSRAKLATVARTLGDRCAVWTAWLDGRPAAALITLRNGTHETQWKSAANVADFGPSRAVDLLTSRAIQDACSAGAVTFDMGESRPGSNLAQFKAGFGAQEHLVHLAERERLPLRRAQQLARNGVKRAIGFRDR